MHNTCKRWVEPPWSPINLFLWNSTRQLEWNSSAKLLRQLKLVMLSNLRLLLINITKTLTMNGNFDALVMCILPFMLYTYYSHLNIQILWKITSIRKMLSLPSFNQKCQYKKPLRSSKSRSFINWNSINTFKTQK